MKLILFSGGVESTALLDNATKEDIILCISSIFPKSLTTYNKDNVEKICNHYGLTPTYATININYVPSIFTFTHQMTEFITICNLMCHKNTDITEIWCGRNSSEPNNNIKDYINKQMILWNMLQENVEFKHPLDYLSKQEQYELIPKEIRKYVSSCIHHSNCGQCNKCKELIQCGIVY